MKQKVPKKNISRTVSDIKASASGRGFSQKSRLAADGLIGENASEKFLKKTAPLPKRMYADIADKKFFLFRKIFLIPLFALLAISLLWGAGVYSKWDKLAGYFNSTNGELENFINKSEPGAGGNASSSKLTIFDFIKNKSLWSNAGSAYSEFQNFSAAGAGLLSEADALGKSWPSLVFGGGGQELIGHLQKAKNYLELMSEANGKLNSLNIGIGDFLLSQYGSPLSFQLSVQRLDDFLGASIKWLSSGGDRHVLVLFENSSEMRPGGGFIGSYADVVFSGGSIKSFEVHDINDADREFTEKIIPPAQLKGIEKGWGIADSNWFFDYPLSASKTIQFMEQSGMYSGKYSFDGVVAISPKVVSDILEMTGPIELTDRNLTIDKDNFLKEIQNEVQNAQASGKPSKKIIAEIAPVILSRLGSFKTGDNGILLQKINDWITGKDMVVYFKDTGIENFLDFYGASGSMFQIPSDFNGDYLAVSSANIGSGKSDIFINQKIFFKTQLNIDGTASDHVEILRENTATAKDPWWYRSPNESYMQVFALPDATLSGFTGGFNKKIIPRASSYSGYAADPLVKSIESTLVKSFDYPLVDQFKESGKKVFGAWAKTAPGQKSDISIDYSVHLFSVPSAGQKYQFVMDKQTGSSGSYDFEIYAPVGFFWEESNSPLFEYKTSEPGSRTTLNLTLQEQKD
ncbi:MAG TPA: DUF4012 domain-containing protein [Candidatus Paceibacterota bacterium]|nr:DUF4012 domain-containing protein [Candidatus Paceibacterota bacterium]